MGGSPKILRENPFLFMLGFQGEPILFHARPPRENSIQFEKVGDATLELDMYPTISNSACMPLIEAYTPYGSHDTRTSFLLSRVVF